MVLTPQTAADLAAVETEPHISDPGIDIDAFRREMATQALSEPRREVAYVRDVDADGVACRVFRPEPGAPVILYAHGGGWVLGDLDTHDRWGRELAVRTGWAVVAVHYRRAPEHPYPAPLDDVGTALSWVRTHAAEHELDATNIVGVGDSSGANLIAGMSVRDPGAFDYQVLAYPPLDPACETSSFSTETNAILPATEMRWFWDAYLPSAAQWAEPDAAPAAAADVAGLPPTLVITAEHDVLRDEGEKYAARLAARGVSVAAQRYLGVGHGFWRRPWDHDAAEAALDLLAGRLARVRVRPTTPASP